MALFYLVFLNCLGAISSLWWCYMLEHGSFLFGVPELFRGDFFPLVVLFDTVTLNAVISLFFSLF